MTHHRPIHDGAQGRPLPDRWDDLPRYKRAVMIATLILGALALGWLIAAVLAETFAGRAGHAS